MESNQVKMLPWNRKSHKVRLSHTKELPQKKRMPHKIRLPQKMKLPHIKELCHTMRLSQKIGCITASDAAQRDVGHPDS